MYLLIVVNNRYIKHASVTKLCTSNHASVTKMPKRKNRNAVASTYEHLYATNLATHRALHHTCNANLACKAW